MPRIECRTCGSTIEYDDEQSGMEMLCGECHTPFRAGEDDRPIRRERRRRRRDVYESDEDEFDSNPEYYYAEAKRIARNPGLWLIVGNCLTLGLMVVSALFFIWFFAFANVKGAALPPGILAFYVVMMGVFGLLEAIRFILGFLGGRALIGLKSKNWAMAGAIASLIPIHGLLSVLYIPFGIWAIVTIQNPVVKWAFERNRNRES